MDGNPINLAEVRLFTAAGVQYTRSQLAINMSSIYYDGSTYKNGIWPEKCLDGSVAAGNFCHSGATDLDAWLRVAYPCKDGLSRVEVINRANFESRILVYRMRALAADGVTDLFPPYAFSFAQTTYVWQVA